MDLHLILICFFYLIIPRCFIGFAVKSHFSEQHIYKITMTKILDKKDNSFTFEERTYYSGREFDVPFEKLKFALFSF